MMRVLVLCASMAQDTRLITLLANEESTSSYKHLLSSHEVTPYAIERRVPVRSLAETSLSRNSLFPLRTGPRLLTGRVTPSRGHRGVMDALQRYPCEFG